MLAIRHSLASSVKLFNPLTPCALLSRYALTHQQVRTNTTDAASATTQSTSATAPAIHPYTMDYKLSTEQLDFLNDQGYLVIRKAISDALVERIVMEAFAKHSNMSKRVSDGGYLGLYHLPSMYELRQSPVLYSIFCQLLETHKLVASIDKMSLKAPMTGPEKADPPPIEFHTDVNYWAIEPRFAGYQAGLCLFDCKVGDGGFVCIPEFHKQQVIDAYKSRLERGELGERSRPPRKVKIVVPFLDTQYAKKHAVEIPLSKGDYIIWNSCLPHSSNTINTNKVNWRIQAFVRYLPLDGPCATAEQKQWNNEVYLKMINHCYNTGTEPTYFPTGNPLKNDNRHAAESKYVPPRLSWLGNRLMGVSPWTDTIPNHVPVKSLF